MMKIKYLFKHSKDGDTQFKIYTLDEIELGNTMEYIRCMRKDGYTLIDRILVG